MARQRLGAKKELVDPATGELYELYLWGRRAEPIDKGYVKVFHAFLQDLIENEAIAGKAVRLLLWMIARMDYNDLKVVVFPKEAMQELGISRRTFYHWIDVLQSYGIIEKVDRYVYKLKPNSVVRGKMHEACKDELDF